MKPHADIGILPRVRYLLIGGMIASGGEACQGSLSESGESVLSARLRQIAGGRRARLDDSAASPTFRHAGLNATRIAEEASKTDRE